MKTFKVTAKVTYAKEVWVVIDDDKTEWDARKEAYHKIDESIDPEVFAPIIDITEVEGGEHDPVMTECYKIIDGHFNKQEENKNEH